MLIILIKEASILATIMHMCMINIASFHPPHLVQHLAHHPPEGRQGVDDDEYAEDDERGNQEDLHAHGRGVGIVLLEELGEEHEAAKEHGEVRD